MQTRIIFDEFEAWYGTISIFIRSSFDYSFIDGVLKKYVSEQDRWRKRGSISVRNTFLLTLKNKGLYNSPWVFFSRRFHATSVSFRPDDGVGKWKKIEIYIFCALPLCATLFRNLYVLANGFNRREKNCGSPLKATLTCPKRRRDEVAVSHQKDRENLCRGNLPFWFSAKKKWDWIL